MLSALFSFECHSTWLLCQISLDFFKVPEKKKDMKKEAIRRKKGKNPSLLFSELHLRVLWFLLVVDFAIPIATLSVRMELVCDRFSLGQVEFSSLESELTCFR